MRRSIASRSDFGIFSYSIRQQRHNHPKYGVLVAEIARTCRTLPCDGRHSYRERQGEKCQPMRPQNKKLRASPIAKRLRRLSNTTLMERLEATAVACDAPFWRTRRYAVVMAGSRSIGPCKHFATRSSRVGPLPI